VALVPRGPSEIDLYYRGGLTRSQQRRYQAQYQEGALLEKLRGTLWQIREESRHKHAGLVADNLTALNDHIQSLIDTHDSPRLEDALEELFAASRTRAIGMYRGAYRDG
jgi:hypothetical protein